MFLLLYDVYVYHLPVLSRFTSGAKSCSEATTPKQVEASYITNYVASKGTTIYMLSIMPYYNIVTKVLIKKEAGVQELDQLSHIPAVSTKL